MLCLIVLLLAVAAPAHAATDTLVVETDWGASYAIWKGQDGALLIKSTSDRERQRSRDDGVLVKIYNGLGRLTGLYVLHENNYGRDSYSHNRWFWLSNRHEDWRTLRMFLPVDYDGENYGGPRFAKYPQGYCWELLLVRNLWIYEQAGYAILDEIAEVLPPSGLPWQCETNYATSIRPSTWGHIKRKGRAD